MNDLADCWACGFPGLRPEGHADFCADMRAEAVRFGFLRSRNIEAPNPLYVSIDDIRAVTDGTCRHGRPWLQECADCCDHRQHHAAYRARRAR